ncbi:MAG: sialate O-acetylesterase [Bacteroidales bacterium]
MKDLILITLLFLSISASGQLKVGDALSSNMVLQREQPVNIWGMAAPKESIQVMFDGQKLKTKADAEGKWRVQLEPMKANKNPQTLSIKGKKEDLKLDNVLIGEVWLASGQSNMEYSMVPYHEFYLLPKEEDLAYQELQKPANNMIRVLNCDRKGRRSEWKVADGESLVKTSQVGYFFGKDLQQKLDVPVGIVTSAIGGTQIEAWTTKETYQNDPTFAKELERGRGKINGKGPGNWYRTMIAPLVPFAFKGVLWYQGENNCVTTERQYARKFELMVGAWRDAFEQENLPFYYVVLLPYTYSKDPRPSTKVTAEELPKFRVQQMEAQKLVPNTEFVIASDLVASVDDIHPPHKWTVAERLVRVAMTKSYGDDSVEWSGPRLRGSQTYEDSIVLIFDHCAEGLTTVKGKQATWFEIAGEDGIFCSAFADISSPTTVKVYHPDVKQPKFVRLGWHETAIPNLTNSGSMSNIVGNQI